MSLITRRQFIETTGLGLAGTTTLLRGETAAAAQAQPAKVVLIRHKDVLDMGGQINESVLGEMLDSALEALFGKSSASEALKPLFGASDVVGIKSNVWHHLPTPRELEHLLVSRLTAVGVKSANIAVDDRGVRSNKTFKRATALINVRPVRIHHWSGIGGCLKNHIMFVPMPYLYHGNSCEPLGAIWNLPPLKGKTRLNILVALTPQFHGVGPHHFHRKYTWPYKGLLLSTDPVALDATGLKLLEAKRSLFFRESRPISAALHHILAADKKYRLGTSDLSKVELIKLGWMKDVLI